MNKLNDNILQILLNYQFLLIVLLDMKLSIKIKNIKVIYYSLPINILLNHSNFMLLMNDNIKMISCSDFKLLLKKIIKDKIEKEWTESFIDDLNLFIFLISNIKRRYQNKCIDLIKLINSSSFYKHVKTNIYSNGSLEIKKQQG